MNESPKLHRVLGLTDATLLVAGSMIGSGIFIVSSGMSRDLGSAGWLLVAWLLTGVITLAAALSYGELAGMMPDAGGQFVYIRRAWGRLTAFLYGWTVFAVIQTGVIASVAVAFANYTSELIPFFSDKNILFRVGSFAVGANQLLAVGLIVFLTVVNQFGVEGGSFVQKLFTSAKLLALFALIVLGIGSGLQSGTLAANFTDIWSATQTKIDAATNQQTSIPLTSMLLLAVLGTTMINSLFSSDAWNNVTFIAGEIREPHKNIPRSLLWGTAIVTVLYILANVAYLCLLPLKGDPNGADVVARGIQFAENDRIGTAAATVIFGQTATVVMAILIMISTFGCNNGIILSGARLYYAMAKDGLFMGSASRLNSRGVPSRALWMQCIWACLLCFSGTYSDLLTYATFASLLFYIITIAGLFILRKKEPDTPRPYKAFAYPGLPIFYIVTASAICIDLLIYQPRNTVGSLAIVAVGFWVYLLMNKGKLA
jgi:APA family basic amino acid/polyamine antiporter